MQIVLMGIMQQQKIIVVSMVPITEGMDIAIQNDKQNWKYSEPH